MITEELLQVSRLALDCKDKDVRMYLATLVRRARKAEPDMAQRLEELLKADPAGVRSVMRESLRDHVSPPQGDAVAVLRTLGGTHIDEPLLPDELSLQLKQVIEERSQAHLLAHHGLKPSTSIIFQGPPGLGKTMTAHWLAHQLSLPIHVLDLTSVMSSLLGKTGSNLRAAIDYARSHPCVLFLDEIDAIAKRRNDHSDVGELKRIVNVLLQELEDWPASGLLIAATNHPELIDPALWRRFDIDIAFPHPSHNQVKKAINTFLADDQEAFASLIDLLVDTMKGKSYSDIKRAINKLRRLKILNPKGFEDQAVRQLLASSATLSRSEKIDLAVKLVSEFSFPKQRAAKCLGVSRDTIRKKLSACEL